MDTPAVVTPHQSTFSLTASGAFEHFVDGVHRATVDAEAIEEYVVNLAPGIFMATALVPQLAPITAILQKALGLVQAVTTAVADATAPTLPSPAPTSAPTASVAAQGAAPATSAVPTTAPAAGGSALGAIMAAGESVIGALTNKTPQDGNPPA